MMPPQNNAQTFNYLKKYNPHSAASIYIRGRSDHTLQYSSSDLENGGELQKPTYQQ